LTSSAALKPENGSAYPQSQFNLNCTNYTVEQLKALNLARGIAGAVSLLTVTLILLFLVLYKAYKTTLQRLFVQLTIVTCLHDFSFVLQIEHQFQYHGQEQFCAFVGFLDMWTSTMVYTFIIGINVFLVYTIYRQLRGDPFSRLSNSRYLRLIVECSFTLLMTFLPLTYLWLPFTTGTYAIGSGPANAICWIKSVKEDCETIQPYSQIVYAETILISTACILHLLFTFGLAIVFCRLAYTYQGLKRQHINNVRDAFLLMCFLLTSVVLDSPAILFVTVKSGEDVTANYGFWIYTLVGPPTSMLVYPIGFLFYLYSLKKFKWKSIKRAAEEWKTSCSCKQKQKRVHFGRKPVTQNLISFPSSHPAYDPSSSFFVVPHTGAFTDTIATVNEDQPLVSRNDTGYSSVGNEQ